MRRAHIKFGVLVNPHEEFLLSLDEMKETVSTERILNNLINAEGSGITVDPQIASELEERLQTLSAFSVPSLDAREADDLSIDQIARAMNGKGNCARFECGEDRPIFESH